LPKRGAFVFITHNSQFLIDSWILNSDIDMIIPAL
jgi:hypothetical protein